jgi:4-amino-4-deoxy-L-arabinose transferase-like glycosyltransferase
MLVYTEHSPDLSSHAAATPILPATERGTRLRYRASILAVGMIYVLLGTGSAMTKLPVCDEAWYANPAFNLSAGRPMATTVLESAGTPLHGLEHHTYWVMPLYIVGQAFVYQLFGPGLLQTRLFSVFWGLVILASWFVILRRLFEDKYVALLGIFVMAIDSYMIAVGSTGRSDMMCAGLGSAGLAAYLWLRSRNLSLALLVGNALIAASGMTHPNGMLYFASLLFLVWSFDRRNVKWIHVGAGAVPYLAGATIWSMYILQSPSDFIAQFGSNARTRTSGITSPWAVIRGETLRYMNAYGLGSQSAGLSRVKAVMLLAYLSGIAGVLLSPRLRQQPPSRVLLSMTGLTFILMVLLEGAKQDWYLVHIIPLFSAVLAVWVVHCLRHRVVPAAVLVLGMSGLVLVNVGLVGWLLHRADYQNTYGPVVQFLRTAPNDRATVMGSAELGFQIGFDRLTDDTRLGFYSRKRPDLVVVEEIYEGWFRKHEAREPDVYRHVRTVLAGARKVFDNGRYRVYSVSSR